MLIVNVLKVFSPYVFSPYEVIKQREKEKASVSVSFILSST